MEPKRIREDTEVMSITPLIKGEQQKAPDLSPTFKDIGISSNNEKMTYSRI